MKNSLASFFLSRKLASNKASKETVQFNFDKVQRVGILFNSIKPEYLPIVENYVKKLRSQGKIVSVLGLKHQKSKDGDDESGNSNFFYFLDADINVVGRLKTEFLKQFSKKKFDLLLNLDLDNHFSLQYLSALSRASFKIGKWYNNTDTVFDMMITVKDNSSLPYFIEQADTYMKMLNNPKSKVSAANTFKDDNQKASS